MYQSNEQGDDGLQEGILNSQVVFTSLTVDVTNFCAVMDTLVNQDGRKV